MSHIIDELSTAMHQEASRIAPSPGAYERTIARASQLRRRRLTAAAAFALSGLLVAAAGTQVLPRDLDQSRASAGDSRPVFRMMADGPLSPRERHTSAWTGDQLVIWGGAAVEAPETSVAPDTTADTRSETVLADGATYDPVSNQWRSMALSPLSARSDAPGVWTGEELIVTGGGRATPEGEFRDGARYKPATDRWTPIAEAPICPQHAALVADHVYVVGSCTSGDQSDSTVSFASYDPISDQWTPLDPPALPGIIALLAWRQKVVLFTYEGQAAVYDPGAGAWDSLPPLPGSTTSAASRERVTNLGVTEADGQLVAVGELISRDVPTVRIFTFGTDGWATVATLETDPPEGGFPQVVAQDGRIVWTAQAGIVWFSLDSRTAHRLPTSEAPTSLTRSSGTLTLLSPETLLVWGGRTADDLAVEGDGVSTNDGVMVNIARGN